MAEGTPEHLREAILAWLNTATESELMEVLELIKVLLMRRRYRDGRPSRQPEPESDRER